MSTKTQLTSSWFMELQDSICAGLEQLDGRSVFLEEKWERPEGGGGRTRIIQQGDLIEKGGVNFSAVHGPLPAKIAEALKVEAADFFATGVSIVLHPSNPWVPIIHMNVRYFELTSGLWWFGGGIDLTPHYADKEMASAFHRDLKAACDPTDLNYYPRFKKWADDYFFIAHRNETRGIGGIFYDRLNESEGKSFEDLFSFTQRVGNTFVPAYARQADHFRNRNYSAREKEWQHIRRGRYVEFNLVYDKGTKFGLDTNGRIESILMSLPPMAEWPYGYTPEKGSAEEQTLQLLKKGIQW